jgi:hypothetical protein
VSTDLVRVEGANISPALAEAGVYVAETNGVRHVHFPDELRARFNVLQPVTAVVAADPLWSPSVRAVALDVGDQQGRGSPHVYPGTRRGMLALSKLGNALLADAAGVRVAHTEPFHEGLRDRQFGWRATVEVRMGDGTWKHVTESHVTDLDDELEAIEAQVLKSAAYDVEQGRDPWPEAKITARTRERWIKEKPHFQAKGETKAVLRAMRLIMQVQHEYPAAALARPFLVVGFSMTPDYSDPDVRRMLLEAGVAGTSRAYGRRAATELVELPGTVEPVVDVPMRGEDDVVDAPPVDTPTPPAEPAFDPATEPAPPVVTPPAPVPPAEHPGSGSDAAKFAEAGRYPIRMGKHKGKAIAQLDAEADGRAYLEWLAGREATTHEGRMLKAMIETYLGGERV